MDHLVAWVEEVVSAALSICMIADAGQMTTRAARFADRWLLLGPVRSYVLRHNDRPTILAMKLIGIAALIATLSEVVADLAG